MTVPAVLPNAINDLRALNGRIGGGSRDLAIVSREAAIWGVPFAYSDGVSLTTCTIGALA